MIYTSQIGNIYTNAPHRSVYLTTYVIQIRKKKKHSRWLDTFKSLNFGTKLFTTFARASLFVHKFRNLSASKGHDAGHYPKGIFNLLFTQLYNARISLTKPPCPFCRLCRIPTCMCR